MATAPANVQSAFTNSGMAIKDYGAQATSILSSGAEVQSMAAGITKGQVRGVEADIAKAQISPLLSSLDTMNGLVEAMTSAITTSLEETSTEATETNLQVLKSLREQLDIQKELMKQGKASITKEDFAKLTAATEHAQRVVGARGTTKEGYYEAKALSRPTYLMGKAWREREEAGGGIKGFGKNIMSNLTGGEKLFSKKGLKSLAAKAIPAAAMAGGAYLQAPIGLLAGAAMMDKQRAGREYLERQQQEAGGRTTAIGLEALKTQHIEGMGTKREPIGFQFPDTKHGQTRLKNLRSDVEDQFAIGVGEGMETELTDAIAAGAITSEEALRILDEVRSNTDLLELLTESTLDYHDFAKEALKDQELSNKKKAAGLAVATKEKTTPVGEDFMDDYNKEDKGEGLLGGIFGAFQGIDAVGDTIRHFGKLGGAIGKLTPALTFLGSAALVAAAGFAGFKIGEWLEEKTGIGKKTGGAAADAISGTAGIQTRLGEYQSDIQDYAKVAAGGTEEERAAALEQAKAKLEASKNLDTGWWESEAEKKEKENQIKAYEKAIAMLEGQTGAAPAAPTPATPVGNVMPTETIQDANAPMTTEGPKQPEQYPTDRTVNESIRRTNETVLGRQAEIDRQMEMAKRAEQKQEIHVHPQVTVEGGGGGGPMGGTVQSGDRANWANMLFGAYDW